MRIDARARCFAYRLRIELCCNNVCFSTAYARRKGIGKTEDLVPLYFQQDFEMLSPSGSIFPSLAGKITPVLPRTRAARNYEQTSSALPVTGLRGILHLNRRTNCWKRVGTALRADRKAITQVTTMQTDLKFTSSETSISRYFLYP